MAVLVAPSEEEMYLLAILEDDTGIDLAEFAFPDDTNAHGRFRLHHYQWPWFMDDDDRQVACSGRAVGKTIRYELRACAMPFNYPQQKILVTAPSLNHLQPLTSAIETRLAVVRLVREMLPVSKGMGITRNPHWEVKFLNGARIVSRIPGYDGAGVKGQHVLQIFADEYQDYTDPEGHRELMPTLNSWIPGARAFMSGVPTGRRGTFYDMTQPGSTWKLHRVMGFFRPSWNDDERQKAIEENGHSRQHIDYRRNIYGEHGDSSSSVLVLHRLHGCCDTDSSSFYNQEVYKSIKIREDLIPPGFDRDGDEAMNWMLDQIYVPAPHKTGWSYKKTVIEGGKSRTIEVGAPKGYSEYFAGMDVGLTRDPSEFLLFGIRADSDKMDLLLRIHMHLIKYPEQTRIIERVFQLYGDKFKSFAMDSTGIGTHISEVLVTHPEIGRRYIPVSFSERRVVGFFDRELEEGEDPDNLHIRRLTVEQATDWLRDEWVDPGRILLPNDNELMRDLGGETFTTTRDSTDPYGRRRHFSYGHHMMDAAKMAAVARYLPSVEARLNIKEEKVKETPVFFLGGL